MRYKKEKEGSSKASPLNFCTARPGLLEGVVVDRRGSRLVITDDARLVYEEAPCTGRCRDRVSSFAEGRRRSSRNRNCNREVVAALRAGCQCSVNLVRTTLAGTAGVQFGQSRRKTSRGAGRG